LPQLRVHLNNKILEADRNCQEAKVEENDYTVLTFDDLEYELGLAEGNIRKKIAFVDNQVWLFALFKCSKLMIQMVSATHTNITPAKLEEFEATFKHFDKDDTNVRLFTRV
jgi:hypothetical protein